MLKRLLCLKFMGLSVKGRSIECWRWLGEYFYEVDKTTVSISLT